MRPLHLVAASALVPALLLFAADGAHAQRRGGVTGIPVSPPHGRFHGGGHHGGQFHRGHFGNVFFVEREVVRVVEVEVEREAPPAAPPPPAPPAPPRKPYVVGASYSALPEGCMKMIEEGAAYYYCSGEWYRQISAGRDARYRAVARP